MSVSLFILFQGGGSITFVPISELYGRRWIYISCLAIFSAVQWVAGTAKSIGLFLAMRILGGYMSSPLLTMAGATIADLYAVCNSASLLCVERARASRMAVLTCSHVSLAGGRACDQNLHLLQCTYAGSEHWLSSRWWSD